MTRPPPKYVLDTQLFLVTDNRRDFERIRQFVQFEFTEPWPGGQISSGERRQ